MHTITRRQFGKSAAAAWVGTAVSAARVLGANDRIRLGFIGLGNRGDQVLDAFLAHADAQVVAICDIYQPYLEFAARRPAVSQPASPTTAGCSKCKDLDAVVINTPDHWHALQMIHACEAGKDVYVEKPLSLVVSEGRAMVEAARRHRRVVQVGHPPPVVGVRQGSGGARAQRRHRQGHRGAVVPHPERVAEGHRRAARRRAAGGLGLGRVARAGAEARRTTRTARSTGSAGSTTTRADSSPTSASTTWTPSTGRSATMRRSPSPRWAARSRSTTTARCRTPSRCCGRIPAARS